MFFERSPRISNYLNGVDLVERSSDSVNRQVVLRRALLLINVLLMQDLQRSAALDPLCLILFAYVALVIDEEPVHLWPQSKEQLTVRLVLYVPFTLLYEGVHESTSLVQ